MVKSLLISLLLVAACSDLHETTYDSIASARADGAFERGWLPADLPGTSWSIREAHDIDTNVGWIAIRYDSAEYAGLGEFYRSREWEFVPHDGSRARVRFPDAPVDWWPVELHAGTGDTPHTDVYTRFDEATGHRWWVFVPPGGTDLFIWHGPEDVAGPLPVADTTSQASPQVERETPVLVLEGEGLRVIMSESGATRPLPFGLPRQDVVSTVTDVLGSEPRESGESADCGMHFVSWPEGLTSWFTRDRFSGWGVAGRSGLTTVSGIGVGSTRSDLLSVYAADIRATSLGKEFVAGGIAGVLESGSPDARITNLWAGTACLAR